MAKAKKKRGAPRSKKWVEMGCEGVTKDGKMKKGWRPPAKAGQCPRPGKGGKTARATKAKGCTPLIRKGMTVAFKRGFNACQKELPADLKAEVARRKDAAGEEFARSYGIPTLSGLRGLMGRAARRRRRRR